MKCEYCGQHSLDNSLICEYCGAPLPVKYTADKKIVFKYIPPHCTGCGRQLTETEAFCEECHTISPTVIQTLVNHPEKPEDGFVRAIGRYHGDPYTDCPHCGTTYQYVPSTLSLPIQSPITICEHCHHAYLRLENNEWSVISPLEKLLFLFFRNRRCLLSYILVSMISCMIWTSSDTALSSGLWGIPIAAILLIVVHLLLDKKKVQRSKVRLDQNPDYPQILAKMGYGPRMNKRYHHLLKSKPLTLKEVLKEAFTFD